MDNNNQQPNRSERDWFLISIIAGITVLVITALIFALQSPTEVEYRSGLGPEDIAFNYMLALQREEYEQAYGYLYSGLEGYPADAAQFTFDINELSRWECEIVHDTGESYSYDVNDINQIGDRALVDMEETVYYRNRSIFDPSSSYTSQFSMELQQTDSGWKLISSDRCWVETWKPPATAMRIDKSS